MVYWVIINGTECDISRPNKVRVRVRAHPDDGNINNDCFYKKESKN